MDLDDSITINKVIMSKDATELHIFLKLSEKLFVCPICGKGPLKPHDSKVKIWRNSDFGYAKCFLHSKLPRTNCPKCGVHLINVPMARQHSNITFVLEKKILHLIQKIPVSSIANYLQLHESRVWVVIKYYLNQLWVKEDWSKVTSLGIDVIKSNIENKFITIFIDMAKSRVIFATEGKDSDTVRAFSEEMKNHGAKASQITSVKMDLSEALIEGVEKYLPQAEKCFDEYHILKKFDEAIEELLIKESPMLKYSKKGKPSKIAAKDDKSKFKSNGIGFIKTGKAKQLSLTFEDIYNNIRDPETFEVTMKNMIILTLSSKIDEIIDIGKMLKENFDGLSLHAKSESKVFESIKSRIDETNDSSKALKDSSNFITMLYLIAGDLPIAQLDSQKK
jgi:transposase